MTTRFLIIIRFIFACIRLGAKPWNFFQLNSLYFNESKGIFSKMEINRLIPAQWRLKQIYANGKNVPKHFPVFMKPEWGQNSKGIIKINNQTHLKQAELSLAGKKQRYLLQEAADASREFEVFYVRPPGNDRGYSNMSITEVENSSSDPLPINGIYNSHTTYTDKTPAFSLGERYRIWNYLAGIGFFRLARVSIRTESKMALLAGNFKIIEINLFLPMPLSLLDLKLSWPKRYALIRETMNAAALAVKDIPVGQPPKAIFFKKMVAHLKVKKWRNCSQDTESFHDQTGSRMTNTLHQTDRKNLRLTL